MGKQSVEFFYLCGRVKIMEKSITEQELLALLKQDDERAFRELFNRFYKYLLVTAYNIGGDNNLAKDLAQDVLLELWRKRASIEIQSSLKSYLRRAVINKTLNHIKAQRLNFTEPEKMPEKTDAQHSAQLHLEAGDLQLIINQAIESLPEKCRIIFNTSYFRITNK